MKKWWSASVGVVAGVFTVGVATLLAGLMTGTGLSAGTPSPVFAVGGAFVDRTPPWLKDFAVATFGTHDKVVLILGMAVVLTTVCAVIGIVGAQRRTTGLVAFGVVGAIGTLSVATRPHAGPLDILPAVVGTAINHVRATTVFEDAFDVALEIEKVRHRLVVRPVFRQTRTPQ